MQPEPQRDSIIFPYTDWEYQQLWIVPPINGILKDYPDSAERLKKAFERAGNRGQFLTQDQRAYFGNYITANTILLLGEGSSLSMPSLMAEVAALANPAPEDNVLEIGCAVGYLLAVFAGVCQHVDGVEINPVLARQARENLERLGYDNWSIHTGDGRKGYAKNGPYSLIVVSAAFESLDALLADTELLDQLKNGGRLIAPARDPQEGEEFSDNLYMIVRTPSGELLPARKLMRVGFVPLQAQTEAPEGF